jgi:hypothetical protein
VGDLLKFVTYCRSQALSRLPKDSVIWRLTLRFASSQIALRMNAQKRLSLANNSDLA